MPRRSPAASARRITTAWATVLVTSGDWLDCGLAITRPDAFDRALAARITKVEWPGLRSYPASRPRAPIDADPDGRHIHSFSWHFSTYDRRRVHSAGRCGCVPCISGERHVRQSQALAARYHHSTGPGPEGLPVRHRLVATVMFGL